MYFADKADSTILAIKQMGKPAVYVANHLDYEDDGFDIILDAIFQGVSKLYPDKIYLITESIQSGGIFFFDSGEQTKEFFEIFNTDPVYASPIYATLHEASGNCIDENT